MAMTSTRSPNGSDRLGCGRDVDEAWAGIDEGPTSHEKTCPYCQSARVSLARLSSATKEMTSADRDDPSLRMAPQVLTDILAIARAEVHRGADIPLLAAATAAGGPPVAARAVDAQHRGTAATAKAELTISEYAIAALVRAVSDRIEGVEARRCSVRPVTSHATHQDEPARPGRPPGGSEPAHIAIEVGISIAHDVSIPDLVAILRHEISSAVGDRVGVTVSRIDITVQDVHDA